MDYIIQGCIELKASAILTIEALTTTAFTQNSCLEVHEFAVIKADGTEVNSITFTFWRATNERIFGMASVFTIQTIKRMYYLIVLLSMQEMLNLIQQVNARKS
ncbi:MAG: hypothetical protein IPJ43_05070 [Saprospiraceae bacterium]|nr:hypothetical protein [Saprospiraceae bacterium]